MCRRFARAACGCTEGLWSECNFSTAAVVSVTVGCATIACGVCYQHGPSSTALIKDGQMPTDGPPAAADCRAPLKSFIAASKFFPSTSTCR